MRLSLLFLILSGLACHAPSAAPSSSSSSASAPAPADECAGTERESTVGSTIADAVAVPTSYRRAPVSKNSFGAWLRSLLLRPGHPDVLLYDGRKKGNQSAHYAVLDLDIGDKDIQQCADAVIRLRAEFLFAGSCQEEIVFHFTNGDIARWEDWRGGLRPHIAGNTVSWRQVASRDGSYANFRAYLETVFMYAGSASLERELLPVENSAQPEIGDVFIRGGFPGHAVIVVDLAQNEAGERIFLLAQSYMPAQDIQILKSFEDISPWYHARSGGELLTPEWVFDHADLKRFPRSRCEAGHTQ